MRDSFELIEPTGPETPVVIEVPHAGLELAAPFLEPLAAPARALGRDADLYVDALYADASIEGATLLVARASRYVIDLNRSEGDIDGEVVEGERGDMRMHHGLVWRTTSDGEPALARKLTRSELDERLELVWRPYHRALAAAIERKRARFGIAIVVAAHSMPSVERIGARNATDPRIGARNATDPRMGARSVADPRIAARSEPDPRIAARSEPDPRMGTRTTGDPRPPNAVDPNAREAPGATPRPDAARLRADVVPGTRGRRSAHRRFIDAVEAHAIGRGWTVRHDDPYAGGYTTQHYGRPQDGVHAIQVELARRLYLEESTLRPNGDFDSVRAWCGALARRLGVLAQAP